VLIEAGAQTLEQAEALWVECLRQWFDQPMNTPLRRRLCFIHRTPATAANTRFTKPAKRITLYWPCKTNAYWFLKLRMKNEN
jgi:hypothetical protein